MIYLEVQDYCQNCPDFEADVCKVTTESMNFEEHDFSDTKISCTKRKRCAGLVRYLTKENTQSENDEDIKIYKRESMSRDIIFGDPEGSL